ncbi:MULTISPECIES: restriction endonuclease subunit S [Heyndrickxia]|uniref:restriction endonuclease subunit S n=1 Tax=Heyndrickxia TaxID=2837504 RepID=UPI0015C598E9|nr:restriction endonuclease subunit S [Heyndrickxia coagulans]
MTHNGWSEKFLGDIATFSQGKQIPVQEQYRDREDGYVRFLRIVDFTNEAEPIRYVKNYGDKYLVGKKDLVMIRYGSKTAGKVVRGYEGLIANNMFKINFSDEIDTDFAYYMLSMENVYNMLNAGQSSSTMPAITFGMLNKLDLLIPPLYEQKLIAKILLTIDNKIKINKQIINTLEELAQSIFKHWFVDFEFPNENGEPYKSSGGKFVESELGMIPEGWTAGTIADLGSVIGGGTPSKKRNDYYTDNGIPWITPKDLSNNKNRFISKGNIDITEGGYKNSSAKLLPAGTVLFSSRAPIGYIAISKNEVTTNQGFKSVVPNSEIGTEFVYQTIKFKTNEIKNMASGSTFKEISGGELKKIPVIIPSLSLIQSYNKIVEPLSKGIYNLEEETNKLTTLRDILLPKLMSGEIRVGEAEEEVGACLEKVN